MQKTEKTVYFLGAGFSADAGGPIQNDIIKTILNPDFEDSFRHDKVITEAKEKFLQFLKRDLEIPEGFWDKMALEDIFTPMDRCIQNGKSFKTHDVKKLVDLRESFHGLMAAAIKMGIDESEKGKGYINKFAKFINNKAKNRVDNIKEDSVSLITTNWDILLDNSLNTLVKRFCNKEDIENSGKIAVVDYCCYISSLDKYDEHIKPGLFALGKGGYNIKYLKLHGSMNWLHCPMCQRMYIKYNEKPIFGDAKHCHHCRTNYRMRNNTSNIKLRGNLLLPTFIKDLSNIQIQLVWQNAGIELAEASKVVFAGYSLPAADFEIRQLLSRCIPNHTEVEVVLYPGKNGDKSENDLNKEKEWYKSFFGNRIRQDDNFIIKTVPDYVDSLVNN